MQIRHGQVTLKDLIQHKKEAGQIEIWTKNANQCTVLEAMAAMELMMLKKINCKKRRTCKKPFFMKGVSGSILIMGMVILGLASNSSRSERCRSLSRLPQ